jgi:acyl transferase domain-containing protein
VRNTYRAQLAYKLDLRGPAFPVQSACSTSLLAVASSSTSMRHKRPQHPA